ncbi:hypothetical protein GINT2_001894 [Glugoides intestinalis]
MHLTSILIASTLISCYFFTKKELESLKRLEKIYENNMPMNENGWVGFAKDIDSILNSINLEDPVVFNKFAPFLLYSVNHNEKLKGMDLRLVYESKNENLKNDWKNHAVQKVKSLRCSFDIYEINDDEIEFCKNFSKLTKLELFCSLPYSFNKSMTWSNSKKVLSILKEIPACTELELVKFDSVMLKDFIFRFDSVMLKDFIDGAASDSDVLQNLNKLKIVFNAIPGIRYLNSAVGKFPSLVTSLKKLSEITIENQAAIYLPEKDNKSDNLVNLIEELPKDITIKLIGRCIELNQERKFANALKENQNFVDALKKKSDTGKVSIVYKLSSFRKEAALRLRDTMKDSMKDSKLNIIISGTNNNGIERHLPITTEILDNLLKVKKFNFKFDSKEIEVEHTNLKDFISSFGPFFQEWDLLRYTDNNLRTEICEVLEFVKVFNTCKSIKFSSNFLEISNECALDSIISEVVNKRDKWLELETSALLIDSENLISIYNKMQENENFKLKADSWLIRVRKGNVVAFEKNFREIYKNVGPKGREEDEFLVKIKALSKISELDAFIINLSNKDVLCIGNGNFHTVFRMLPTIKNMFKKVFVAEKLFSKDQIKKLRAELRKGGTCTLEILSKESLLTPWLTSQCITNKNYLIRLFLWLKTIFRCYS